MQHSSLNLIIDGMSVKITRGQTIKDAISALSLTGDTLNSMPLAAQIGGRIYDLNYSPKSEAEIRLLRYGCEAGRRIYERSLKFILLCAIRRVLGAVRVVERYSLGKGVYITVESKEELTPDIVATVENECHNIVREDLPFVRRRLSIKTAKDYFIADGQEDKAALLDWRKFDYFDVYTIDDSGYMDYFYGQMLPSTGYVTVFDLEYCDGAFIMLMPARLDPCIPEKYSHPPKLANVFKQSETWGELMSIATVSDLNRRVKDGSIRELIRVNEALHERSYAQMADKIIASKARAVMVAGPSSSGKTTSANRLATQLRAMGLDPVMLSLDNYYIDRDKLLPNENGELDLEHINTLDTKLFSHNLAELIHAGETLAPIFDFKTGKRESQPQLIKTGRENPIIIEGIHGLNPAMLTCEVADDEVFRVYVSALTTLNLDDHNRIRTADVRLLRRLVRDYETRNAGMDHTLSMWSSVRRGEETWIFPYQEQADVIFNTTLVYELALLKRYAYPLLNDVKESSPFYADARELVKFLNYFLEADIQIEREVPPTSILREFIGENVFYS